MPYQGRTFEELDAEAVINRAPELVVVDELAHTNVPGSGEREKRWEDVAAILTAGIDVFTTVNIQHLESLGDVVGRSSAASSTNGPRPVPPHRR